MTPKELKNIIANSKNANWYNSINETINFKWIDSNLNFTTVSALHEFIFKQLEGWNQKTDVPEDLLNEAIRRYKALLEQIEYFVTKTIDYEENYIIGTWQSQVKSHLDQIGNYFTYNSPEITFLTELYKKSAEQYLGALAYIKGNTDDIRNKNYFDGALQAYEFKNKNGTTISKRITKENNALANLKDEFQTYFNQTDEHLINNLNEASQKVKDFVDDSINYKNAKETEVNNWHDVAQANFTSFVTDSKTKIADLEKTYEELLRLKKPAEFWGERATTLKSEGRAAMAWLIGLILVAGICLYFLLWQTPEGMLTSVFGDDKAKAIRWSIVFITFISLVFLGIRYLSKVMFSSFHLSRDAEERQQLTHVYLALIKESAIDEKDRQLIMQSLFSRADSGLLKEDSSPTMPNGIDKIMR